MKSENVLGVNKEGQGFFLSIVVPLFNEEECVDKLVARILEAANRFDFAYEIILVDDGSTDRTWERIERMKESVPQLRGIKFRRNYGQTAAMVAGFEHSRGEVIVTMDGDLQNDPADIPILLDKMKEGYDIVSGWREDRKDHWSRVLPSKAANWMISKTTGVRLHDYGCSLKAYRADCIKSIRAYGEMHRFFPVMASMAAARVGEITVRHHARKYGASKYGFNRIFKVFSDLFSIIMIVKFSGKPLLAFSLCAIPFLVLGAFFILLVYLSIVYDWTEVKTPIFLFSCCLSFFGAIHLISLGVIAEMVVAASDLTHTILPQVTGKKISISPKIAPKEKE